MREILILTDQDDNSFAELYMYTESYLTSTVDSPIPTRTMDIASRIESVN